MRSPYSMLSHVDCAAFEQKKSTGEFTGNLLVICARDGLSEFVRSRRFPPLRQ
jgi:hypothetical protein